jgi:hypothetical protein
MFLSSQAFLEKESKQKERGKMKIIKYQTKTGKEFTRIGIRNGQFVCKHKNQIQKISPKTFISLLRKGLITKLIFFLWVGICFAYPKDLWKGLIAEAVGEGYRGMYAVACVYRNRIREGLPLGCVGLKRKDLESFVAKQGKKYEIMAKQIIEEVFEKNGKDITNGATHYENIERFGIPYWAKEMEVTCKIGNHTFYREK